MSTAQDRVLELIASGKVTPAEGELLLRSLRPARRPWWQVALNPFDTLPTRLLWAAAVITAGLSVVVAGLGGIRFDGALDIHVVAPRVSWLEMALDQIVGWPLTALVMWSAALVFARQSRLFDFLSFVGAARAPLLLAACIAAPMLSPLAGSPAPSQQSVLLLSVVILIPFLVWFIALLVAAMRTASGLNGGRLAAAVTASITAAEAISKVVLGLAHAGAGR
jgi:hypothetical protein